MASIRDELVFDHSEIVDEYISQDYTQEEPLESNVEDEIDEIFMARNSASNSGKVFKTYEKFQDLDEAIKTYSNNVDGVLAAKPPFPRNHPNLKDNYVVTGKKIKKWKNRHYEGIPETDKNQEAKLVRVEYEDKAARRRAEYALQKHHLELIDSPKIILYFKGRKEELEQALEDLEEALDCNGESYVFEEKSQISETGLKKLKTKYLSTEKSSLNTK